MSIAPLLAVAQVSTTAAPAGVPFAAELLSMTPWLLLMGIWFYFLILRPQKQRAKQAAELIASMKKGDEVIMSGGIKGRLTKVGAEEVEVEVAQGVKLRVVKSTINQLVTRDSNPAND